MSSMYLKVEENDLKKPITENIPSKHDIFLPEIDTPIEVVN